MGSQLIPEGKQGSRESVGEGKLLEQELGGVQVGEIRDSMYLKTNKNLNLKSHVH